MGIVYIDIHVYTYRLRCVYIYVFPCVYLKFWTGAAFQEMLTYIAMNSWF